MLVQRALVRRHLGAAATAIAVVLGLVVSATNASAADAPGRIDGAVTSAAPGFDPTQVRVYAYRDGPMGGVDYGGDTALVRSDGSYSIDTTTPGRYRLLFSDSSNRALGEWWDNAETREQSASFTVAAGEVVTGKNAFLEQEFKETSIRRIIGTYNVGQPLTVESGLSPTPEETRVDWFTSGIKVASGTSFVPPQQLLGIPISATVTVLRAGYRPKTVEIQGSTVRPGPPRGTSVSVTSTTAQFFWQQQRDEQYRLRLPTRRLTYDLVAGSGQIIRNLDPGRTYTAQIFATYGTPSSQPTSVTFTTAPLAKPAKLEYFGRTRKAVGIRWASLPGAGRATATVRTKGKKAKVVRLGIRGGMVRGLKPGTKYSVKVTVYSTDGLSKSTGKTLTVRTRR